MGDVHAAFVFFPCEACVHGQNGYAVGMDTGLTSSAISARPPAAGAAAPPRAAGAAAPTASRSGASQVELSPEALALIAKLKARDTEVRQHEQAHLAAAGGLAISGASYVYQRGPNGVNYAVGGEVQIDTSPGRTPEETIARAQAVIAAALAPAEPSGADLAVAAQAQQLAQQARSALARERSDEHSSGQDGKSPTPTQGQALQRAYGEPDSNAHEIDIRV